MGLKVVADGFCTLLISWMWTNFSNGAFIVAGPQVWNYLPTYLRHPDFPYSHCRQLLKTFLIGQWDQGAVLITPLWLCFIDWEWWLTIAGGMCLTCSLASAWCSGALPSDVWCSGTNVAEHTAVKRHQWAVRRQNERLCSVSPGSKTTTDALCHC